MFNKDVMLEHHLQYNHYLPIDLCFVAVAKEAIECVESGEYDQILDLPNGRKLSAGEIIEGLHLDSFIEA